MSFLDLPILNDQGIALGAIVAEDGSGIECQVEFLGPLTGRVAKEADLLSSRFSAKSCRRCDEMLPTPVLPEVSSVFPQAPILQRIVNDIVTRQNGNGGVLHEGIIDRDDKNLTSVFELRGVNVARDMRSGARGA